MCVFCELRVADSPEHLTPDWLRRSLPRYPKAAIQRRTVNVEGPREIHEEGTPFDVSERCVCTPCNTHWMSAIDNAVKRELLPFVLGQSLPLDTDAQRRMASWAFKTCLVYQQTSLEVVDPYVVIPREHYRYLYGVRRRPRPPDRVQIWLAEYIDPTYSLGNYFALEMLNDGSLPTGTKAYGATLVVGKLVVQTFATYGYDDNLPPLDLVKWGGWDQVLVPIWPPSDTSRNWPGAAVLDDATLVQFVGSWSNGKLDPRIVRRPPTL